jgi:hypothetical protein
MKKILAKIINYSIITSLLIVPMLSVQAIAVKGESEKPVPVLYQIQAKEKIEQINQIQKDAMEQIREREQERLENLRASTTLSIKERIEVREKIAENIMVRASTTEKRLENRESNIERIRERIASTTASLSEKRAENLDNRLEKQQQQMNNARERLLGKELKVTDVLGKIAEKIQERISIMSNQGIIMTTANAKLTEATSAIEDLTAEAANLGTLLETEITSENKDELLNDVRASQNQVRTQAREIHALLVDTVKEITKLLPTKTATTTIE